MRQNSLDNEKLDKDSTKRIRPDAGMAIGIAVIFIVAVLSWLALNRIETRSRQNIEGSLLATLNISHEALNGWADDRKDRLGHFAERPDVITLVERLLKVSKDKESLAQSSSLKE